MFYTEYELHLDYTVCSVLSTVEWAGPLFEDKK